MPVQPRERFNTKGRQVPGKKEKQRKQKAHNGPEMQEDSNADIITPKSDAEKDKERKEKAVTGAFSKTQASLPSSLLQSSSTLGTGRLATHEELQARSEDKDVKRALDGRLGKRKRHRDAYDVSGPLDDNDSDDASLMEK
ncbi:hypothetical protein BDQ17DRAFT_1440885 [Cyathus striatus]|nr:hypothetical protein BDQ17DRAFT_1440885 [Cyathus striatus]